MQSAATRSNGLLTFLRSKDMALAGAVVVIVALLILPLPAVLVDLMMAVNLALSIGILFLTLYINRPVEFSLFPTVLLLSTLFRLGINIATTRLILSVGSAGKVVETFGSLLVGGNYVIGVIIFIMLMIIQFVVINNGSSRVAEVAARFTLDAMPGKQLAIDADLNAGLIDEGTARERRKQIQREADFYGSMDGASKFVKGDSTAALIIMLVNVLGGFIIGVVQGGMDIMMALQNYTLLTVGAGLAIQIPALLISASAGLIVTRTDSDKSLGTDLFTQIGNINTLTMASIVMGLMAVIPGLPKIPFILIAGVLGGAAFLLRRGPKPSAGGAAGTGITAPSVPMREEAETPEQMLEMVVVDPVELEIGYGLIPLIDDTNPDNLLRRVTGIRRQLMAESGIILPIVRIRDNLRLQPYTYIVKVRGQEISRGEIMTDRLMAIPGSDAVEELRGIRTTEPAFGLPAYWISEVDRGQAELLGFTVVNPISVLSTHLLELFRNFAPDLLTRQMVQEMLDQLRHKAPASVEGVVPEMLSLGELQSVLRNLLNERVPIRDLQGILETLANNVMYTKDVNILAEAVRQRMANTISSLYKDNTNTIHVFTLSPQIEALLRNSLGSSGNSVNFQIDANLAQRILGDTGKQMEKLAHQGMYPILLTPRELRLAFRKMVEHVLPNLVVLAYSEISPGTKLRAHGMVEIPLG